MTHAAQAPARTPYRRTREQREARSLELAEARGLGALGTPRLLAENHLRRFYGVRKASPAGEYVVIEDCLTGSVACDCPAGARNFPCAHAGAVLHLMRERDAALPPVPAPALVGAAARARLAVGDALWPSRTGLLDDTRPITIWKM